MTINRESCEMLIRFYNMKAGTKFRPSNERNVLRVQMALDRADGNVEVLKDHVRKYVADNADVAKSDMWICFDSFVKTEQPSATEVQQTEEKVASSLGILEQALIEVIKNTSLPKIETEIMGSVQDEVRNFIKNEYGAIERKVTTVVDGVPKQMGGIQHEKFETVLKFVANDEPVFLTGPAGNGKNELCKQVAKALDLKFYFTNAVTQEYKLTGFTDAMGEYQETQFFKAFTEGGLFMLDEMDASIPEVLVILNAAIANRYFDFPAPIGYREAHPDFRVIAAGNTLGHGADFEYVGRNQLDSASLDRFAVVRIDYSPAIEEAVANGDMELLTFCREFRKGAGESGLSIVLSYRGIKRIAKMQMLLSLEETLETCLTRGLEKDDINMILPFLSDSKYKTSLRKIAA